MTAKRPLIRPNGDPWFMAKLKRDPATGCLIYQGKSYKGSAILRTPGGGTDRLPRIVYEHHHGPQPSSLTIWTVCGNGACGEISHVKAGERRDALASKASTNISKTACKRGHPFNETNTYLDPSGRRRCRACARQNEYAWAHATAPAKAKRPRRSRHLLTEPAETD